MKQIKRRKVISGLKKKGFQWIPNKRNDLWFGLVINGELEPRVKTFVSGGGKKEVIYEPNIQNMVKQLYMENKAQFFNYVNCPYTYEEYIESLRDQNII